MLVAELQIPSNKSRIITLDDMYNSLNQLGTYGFVIACEEDYHDRVMHAVNDILKTIKSKRIIFLAGPSGSAKTTTANRIKEQLENYGVPVLRISMDDYFLSLSDRVNIKSYESPKCVDWDTLTNHLYELLEGHKVRSRIYNFVRGISELGPIISLPTNGVIICEGIHALNPDLFNKFKGICKGIYVAPRTRIENQDRKILHPQDLRLARRILRDSRTRGRGVTQIMKQAISVDKGEALYITPFKEKASIHIDTSLDYEICVISKILHQTGYIYEMNKDSLLYEILSVVPRYIGEKHVPQNSILKEFIG